MTATRLDASELHVHVSGAIGASLVPWWLHWLRGTNPDLVVNVSLTPSALGFVSKRAVSHLVSGHVWTDAWDQPDVPSGVHGGTSGQAECIIVFPACLDTLMRLASGRADSPAVMMMQLATMPIVLADSMPGSNEIIDEQLERLGRRRNVHFAPRVAGVRATTREEVTTGFNLPGAIEVANEAIATGRSEPSGDTRSRTRSATSGRTS